MTDTPDEEGVQVKLIIDAGLLGDCVEALDPLVGESRIHFLDGLIRLWAVDPANVSGCYIDLVPSEWDGIKHYSVQQDGFTTAIDIEDLGNVLGSTSSGDLIQISYGEAHSWKFNIQLPKASVTLRAIDPESVRQEPDKPELPWEAIWDMSGEDLKDAMDMNDMFSDHTTVTVGDHQAVFDAYGDDDGVDWELEEPDDLDFIEHPDEQITAMYSLDYFTDLARVLKDHDDIRVKIADSKPIMLVTDLFTYMLAPRLDSTK